VNVVPVLVVGAAATVALVPQVRRRLAPAVGVVGHLAGEVGSAAWHGVEDVAGAVWRGAGEVGSVLVRGEPLEQEVLEGVEVAEGAAELAAVVA
jgi:hypothetical protein